MNKPKRDCPSLSELKPRGKSTCAWQAQLRSLSVLMVGTNPNSSHCNPECLLFPPALHGPWLSIGRQPRAWCSGPGVAQQGAALTQCRRLQAAEAVAVSGWCPPPPATSFWQGLAFSCSFKKRAITIDLLLTRTNHLIVRRVNVSWAGSVLMVSKELPPPLRVPPDTFHLPAQ